MNQRNTSNYMRDVDDLITETSLDTVLSYYGFPLASSGAREHRMNCVFNEECSDNQYGNLSIELHSVKRLYCHSCQVRGNLLVLLHGLEHGRPPSDGRLRGKEFKDSVAKLREINNSLTSQNPINENQNKSPIKPKAEKLVNVPLVRHEKQTARELANLHEELISDVAVMRPEAAEYIRRRSWLTEEQMQQWGVGWIPGEGRSLFRKNYLVYTHRNELGEVVSYSGRDLIFESKWTTWIRKGKPEGGKPGKHRFVAGYHRGAELYGGQADRLNQAYVQQSLSDFGLVVVEGMNEVLRMETLEVAAVGLGSNRATDAQLEKLIRFAQKAGGNRALLLPDCDGEGESGFRELLWRLAEAGVETRLAFTSESHGGMMKGRQPEELSNEEWRQISGDLLANKNG